MEPLTPKQRMAAVFRGEEPDRIPYAPSVYEHGAFLINKTPTAVARNSDLMAQAALKAFETYQPDLLSVGIDLYNVEAEALGCQIRYHRSKDVPGVVTHPLADENNLLRLKIPDPSRDGRMPVVIEAAEKVVREISDQVNIGCPVCGPFSLAAELRGFENLLVDMAEGRAIAYDALALALEVDKEYGKAILHTSAGVSIFESWATVPLISPKIFQKFILPYEKALISFYKEQGQAQVPLIIGGDTTALIDLLIETGSSLIIADYNADFTFIRRKIASKEMVLRGNIDPKLVQRGPIEAIKKTGRRLLQKLEGDRRRFILGTGAIPFDTTAEHVLALKEILIDE